MDISRLYGIEIFDSRGMSTLEVHCVTKNGQESIASVPSGAFAGQYEAIPTKDITTAIRNIESVIAPAMQGKSFETQSSVDELLLSLDGTQNKEQLGGNTLLGVSLACCRALATSQSKTLVAFIQEAYGVQVERQPLLPMFNIINGGAHADNNLTFQEFMVVPLRAEISFKEKCDQGVKIFHVLKERLEQMKKSTNVGDEGGFAPELNADEEAIEILVEAIQEAGYTPGKDIGIAVDIAANGVPDLMIATYPKRPLDYYASITQNYPIIVLEDPFTDNNWSDWQSLTTAIGSKVELAGDDLFTTNQARLKIGIDQKAGNSISIKPNQIGTVSETLLTIKMAVQAHFSIQVSHRSGETEDTFISDLAVAVGAKYLKAGAPNRGERIAKYNQVIRLESLK